VLIVPVGGTGFFFFTTFLTAFLGAAFFAAFLGAAFFTAFLGAAFLAMSDSPFLSFAREGYHAILNLLQYQLSSRIRRASNSRRRCAMSLAASKARA